MVCLLLFAKDRKKNCFSIQLIEMHSLSSLCLTCRGENCFLPIGYHPYKIHLCPSFRPVFFFILISVVAALHKRVTHIFLFFSFFVFALKYSYSCSFRKHSFAVASLFFLVFEIHNTPVRKH